MEEQLLNPHYNKYPIYPDRYMMLNRDQDRERGVGNRPSQRQCRIPVVIYKVPYFPVLPGLPFEPKSDIPRLHKSSILGFHVQDRSDHPKPSEQLGRLDIIAKPILQG